VVIVALNWLKLFVLKKERLGPYSLDKILNYIFLLLLFFAMSQCFHTSFNALIDAVGWAAGRASDL